MKDLVEMIAKALVDNPEQVIVTEVENLRTERFIKVDRCFFNFF